MKWRLLATALLLVLPYSLKAQNLQPIDRQASTPPSDARFEIFQSPFADKSTLMLDRVTGNVQRLLPGKSANLVWEKMKVLPHPKAVNTAKPHFQIFASSTPDVGGVMLLLDTESGATWRLIPKVGVWQPIQ
jgi:hypothetical protein